MSFGTTLLLALGLAMDALAVSLGIGISRYAREPRALFRLSFHFGLFQALMPVLGWLAGRGVAGLISSFDHWLALGLLSFVGIRMIRSGLASNGEQRVNDPSRGGTLILSSMAVSIDALAVGLSLALLNVTVFYPAVIFGIVTSALSLFGLQAGNRLGKVFGKRMEILGGILLIAIGLRILLSHLL